MASLKRKNFLVEERALRKAQRILRAKTESDAVRQAISLVAFRKAVMRGYDRAAGKFANFPVMGEIPKGRNANVSRP